MAKLEEKLLPRKSGDDTTEERVPPLPDNFRIPILYQDNEIMLVDKPYDIRVDGDFPVTVEKLVREGLQISLDKFRMCNQLDYATSGALVLGMSKVGTRNCNKLFSGRKAIKFYLAVGKGVLAPSHKVLQPITIHAKIFEPADDFRMQIDNERGLDSTTVVVPVRTGIFMNKSDQSSGIESTLFLVRLLTGRRHQIRLHLRHIGYPIVGDATYGDRDDDVDRMMLHAWKLTLPYKDRTVKVQTGIIDEISAAADPDHTLMDELIELSENESLWVPAAPVTHN